jgi:hypothetical protein
VFQVSFNFELFKKKFLLKKKIESISSLPLSFLSFYFNFSSVIQLINPKRVIGEAILIAGNSGWRRCVCSCVVYFAIFILVIR